MTNSSKMRSKLTCSFIRVCFKQGGNPRRAPGRTKPTGDPPCSERTTRVAGPGRARSVAGPTSARACGYVPDTTNGMYTYIGVVEGPGSTDRPTYSRSTDRVWLWIEVMRSILSGSIPTRLDPGRDSKGSARGAFGSADPTARTPLGCLLN